MAQYPGSEGEKKFRPADLADAVTAIFIACDMSAEDARTVADSLVAADLRGIHSHGVMRLPSCVAKLREGGVDPRGRPNVASACGGAIVVDGSNAMGQVVAGYAMRQAIESAATSKVAIASVRNSNHCGALDYWAMMALERDMIGLAITNAIPNMAPWGGVEKIVGMNPLAIAVPAGEQPALVMDLAFAAAAHGKIRVYHQKGLAIPDGWALDKDGKPTTDSAAALNGLTRPIGDHKGVALGIMMGVLSTVLSGASYGTELGTMETGARPGKNGHLFMAIDISAFRSVVEVRAEIDRISRQIQDSPAKESTDRLYPPGLMECDMTERHQREGIPLNEATLAGIRGCATALGVDLEGRI